MQILEIKIGELVSFVEGEQYKRFHPKPITGLRAVSQANNPDANAEDIALIIAHEKDTVLGFVGLLPRSTTQSKLQVYSNSCWWVDPEKGKGIAIPLFLMALKKCNFQMYLVDCTTYTQKILEKTGYFQFAEAQSGIRGILRFYFSDISQKRFKKSGSLLWLFSLVDNIMNFLWSPVRFYYIKKYKNSQLGWEEVSTIDEETVRFINAHSKNDFLLKTQSVLDWIKKYPWVKQSSGEGEIDYPFSYLVEKYELKYFKLQNDGEIVAFVAISVRDNLVKIPFIYLDNKFEEEILNNVLHFILEEKYDSFVTFHPLVVRYLQQAKLPLIYKRNIYKRTGATNELYDHFSSNPFLQDGDGDVVFT